MSIGVPQWTITLMSYEPLISTVSVIVNLVHLVVLTRREMRNSSTNVIMIGMAVMDLYSMGLPVVKIINRNLERVKSCPLPDSYLTVFLSWITTSLQDDSRRCTTFLGLSMAIIRVFVIRNSTMRSTWKIFENMSGPRFGWKIVFYSLIISSIISVAYHLRSTVGVLYQWTPRASWGCNVSEWPANYSQPAYALLASDLFAWNNSILSRIYLFVDGLISKILPTILFPILTVILIRQLRKVSENRDRLFSEKKKDKSSLTTKLVIYMTISFMISSMPLGILYVTQSLCSGYECIMTTGNLMYVCILLMAVNSITHFLICITVSTQYQNTVKSILGIDRKKTEFVQSTVLSTNAKLSHQS